MSVKCHSKPGLKIRFLGGESGHLHTYVETHNYKAILHIIHWFKTKRAGCATYNYTKTKFEKQCSRRGPTKCGFGVANKEHIETRGMGWSDNILLVLYIRADVQRTFQTYKGRHADAASNSDVRMTFIGCNMTAGKRSNSHVTYIRQSKMNNSQ